MKHPTVNYLAFRPSKINDPQFSHLKLLLSWPVFLVVFFLTERLIPAQNCLPVHIPLDDLIPFCEWFLIPYASWYFLIAGSLLYFLLYNVDSFKKLQTYIIITQILCMAAVILFPTRQDLRPLQFPRENLLTQAVAFLYSIDTNTGVCPSIHVAFSIAIGSVCLRDNTLKPLWKILVAILVVLICLSTLFLKQHSALDLIAALPVCLVAEILVFGPKKRKQTP